MKVSLLTAGTPDLVSSLFAAHILIGPLLRDGSSLLSCATFFSVYILLESLFYASMAVLVEMALHAYMVKVGDCLSTE